MGVKAGARTAPDGMVGVGVRSDGSVGVGLVGVRVLVGDEAGISTVSVGLTVVGTCTVTFRVGVGVLEAITMVTARVGVMVGVGVSVAVAEGVSVSVGAEVAVAELVAVEVEIPVKEGM